MQKNKEKANRLLMTRDEYHIILDEVKEAAATSATKTQHQRHLLRRYEILTCGQVSKLVLKRKDETEEPKHFIFVEEMYDVLKRIHVVTGRGGRDKMLKEAGKKYANIRGLCHFVCLLFVCFKLIRE